MNDKPDPAVYREKYGPWAVITGASDGTGAAYAHQLAAMGINLVLIARRPGPLAALAAELEQRHGIATRTASIDLYGSGAAERVLAAADGLDVGLFISNAGADTNGKRFLDVPLDTWRQLINRNVLTVTELAYGFAGPMVGRGRGGIILMSSGSGLGGQPGVSVYSATKAFDLNLAEGLWAELKDLGPVLQSLADAGPALTRSLSLFTTYPFSKENLTKWFRGDYANISIIADLTLSRLDSALFTGTRWEGDLTELELQWGRTIGQFPSPYTRANQLTVPYRWDQGP